MRNKNPKLLSDLHRQARPCTHKHANTERKSSLYLESVLNYQALGCCVELSSQPHIRLLFLAATMKYSLEASCKFCVPNGTHYLYIQLGVHSSFSDSINSSTVAQCTFLAETLVLSPSFGHSICSVAKVSQGTRFPLLSVPAVTSLPVFLNSPSLSQSLPHTNADCLALRPCVIWF